MKANMKERPILFSAPMVRALLDGSKTQTRRVVKPQPAGEIQRQVPGLDHWIDSKYWERKNQKENHGIGTRGFTCPHGKAGHRLWVREAWRVIAVADCFAPREITAASRIWYEAQGALPFHPSEFGRLRPSMFMPRWASRITLEITGVRVERLQDISEADALAEGVVKGPDHYAPPVPEKVKAFYDTSARRAYRHIWETINGPGSWAVNPWVWVIEFKVIK